MNLGFAGFAVLPVQEVPSPRKSIRSLFEGRTIGEVTAVAALQPLVRLSISITDI